MIHHDYKQFPQETKVSYIPIPRSPCGSRRLSTHSYNRKKALERDNYRCQMCFDKAVLVHHVIPVWERRDIVNHLDNLMSLCEDCHKLAHGYKRGWKMNTLEEEHFKEIDNYVRNIVYPIFMKAIIEKQRRDNKSLEDWMK